MFQLLNFNHPAVLLRLYHKHVREVVTDDPLADITNVASVYALPLAKNSLCQFPGKRGLADAFLPGKNISVRQPIICKGILK